MLSHAQPDLERLDVALGAADVALRRERGVDAAVEHRALALGAGRQADRQRVADAHAVDVGLLDVGADPEVVGVDERDDRLAGVDDLADARRADVDDAVDRRVDLGVGEPHVGLGALRRRPPPACARWSAPGCAGRATCSAFDARQRDRRALRLDLLLQRVELRLRRRRARSAPDRAPAATRRPAATGSACASKVSRAFSRSATAAACLRFGRGERRFGLADLIDGLPLLEAQRRFRLRGPATTALRRSGRVVRAVGLQLVGRDHGERADPSSRRRLRRPAAGRSGRRSAG